MRYAFSSTIWRWDARREDWFFATVPPEFGLEIREIPRPTRGFGAVRVEVRIGGTRWRTSIFPSDDGSYVLPLKKAVRTAEGLQRGGVCEVELEVLG